MGDFTSHQMCVIRSASLKTMKNWKRSKRRAADCSISFEGIIIIGANILQKRTHQSHSPHSGQSDTLQKTLHVGQLGSFGASLRSFRGQAGQNSALYSVCDCLLRQINNNRLIIFSIVYLSKVAFRD